ncbi:MAG: type IV pilus biogenesis/stability protein PilW [Burkholderiales bacterium]|jgi:type IV pilus assembly protein PilF|nr:type IV pilus biogenesis/stability protein PilW [Burkholderiales bacterium]
MFNMLRFFAVSFLTIFLIGCAGTGQPIRSEEGGFPTTTDNSQLLGPSARPSLQPTIVSPRSRAEAHTALALGYYERRQFDIALEELDLAKGIDSNYAMIYNGYGLVYSYMNEDAKARGNFEQAIRLDPNNSEIRHNWGWFLCTSGHPRESLAEFDRVAADPLYKTPEISYTNAGRCALGAGDIEAARGYLQQALRIKPNYAPAAYTLADIAYRQGDYNGARSFMRMVMQSPTPAADALYLGACIERRMNDRQAEESYILQLRNRYPQARQTQKILGSESCQ